MHQKAAKQKPEKNKQSTRTTMTQSEPRESTKVPSTEQAPAPAGIIQGCRHIPPPEKPIAPVLQQIVTNDVTTEKLAVIMNRNPRGIIRWSDELAGFLRQLNLYHGGKGADRQFYLSVWSGSTAQIDRKTEDMPILVSEPFANILGGIQPSMLGELQDERGRDDGFVDRFLMCYPRPTGRRTWDDAKGVSVTIRQRWSNIVDWLLALEMEPGENTAEDPQPRTLRFSDDAAQGWSEWHRKHWDETEWDVFPMHLRGVWAKFEVHALVLVLVVHMLKVACDNVIADKKYDQTDPAIDAESMRRGLKLADYFKDHCVRVFNRLQVSEKDLRAQRLIDWIRRQPNKSSTLRQLQMNGVAGIKTASEALTLLRDLEDRGLGKLTKPGSGERGKTSFQAA
jgi:hypothetical protein